MNYWDLSLNYPLILSDPRKYPQLDSGIIVADNAAAQWAENRGDGIEDY